MHTSSSACYKPRSIARPSAPNPREDSAMLVAAAPIALLYEDAALVIVDKPAGLPVAPAPGWSAEACVQGRVAGQLGRRLWVVHRLDRDTSGALAFARSAPAHRALSLAFEHRDVHKAYRALVAGVPVPPAGAIDLPLHEARRGKTRPATAGEAGAREASTAYRVLSVWRDDGQAVVARRGAAAHRAPSSDPRPLARHRHTGARRRACTGAATRCPPRHPRPAWRCTPAASTSRIRSSRAASSPRPPWPAAPEPPSPTGSTRTGPRSRRREAGGGGPARPGARPAGAGLRSAVRAGPGRRHARRRGAGAPRVAAGEPDRPGDCRSRRRVLAADDPGRRAVDLARRGVGSTRGSTPAWPGARRRAWSGPTRPSGWRTAPATRSPASTPMSTARSPSCRR